MYFGEAARLEWDDLQLDAGELVGDREKLGRVVRIGVLWERTTDVLRRIRRRPSGSVFVNDGGKQMSYLDLKRLFDKARLAAGLTDVMPPAPQTSDVRDGAYTAAIRAKVGPCSFTPRISWVDTACIAWVDTPRKSWVGTPRIS
jgi:integrase